MKCVLFLRICITLFRSVSLALTQPHPVRLSLSFPLTSCTEAGMTNSHGLKKWLMFFFASSLSTYEACPKPIFGNWFLFIQEVCLYACVVASRQLNSVIRMCGIAIAFVFNLWYRAYRYEWWIISKWQIEMHVPFGSTQDGNGLVVIAFERKGKRPAGSRFVSPKK